MIENDKKTREVNFVADGTPPPATLIPNNKNSKSLQNLATPTGNMKSNLMPVGTATVYNQMHNIKKDSVSAAEKFDNKHLFNWEILNKNKYIGNDKNLSRNDSPGAIVRKNAHLDALEYNPAANLAPVNEEEIKLNVSAMEQPPSAHNTQSQKKLKVLSKIDESLLSSAARNQQNNLDTPLTNVKDGSKSNRTLPPTGKLKPIHTKAPLTCRHNDN